VTVTVIVIMTVTVIVTVTFIMAAQPSLQFFKLLTQTALSYVHDFNRHHCV
jgi:hypothetical protein